MTDKPKNIYQRIQDVATDIGAFGKDSENTFHRYKYAGVEAIVAEVREACTKHGLVLIQSAERNEPVRISTLSKDGVKTVATLSACTVITKIVNVDNPEEVVTVETPGDGQDALDKGIYKALSGARKYGIFGAFNLHAGDTDPENDGGRQSGQSHQATPQRQQQGAASSPPMDPAKIDKAKKILFPKYEGEWPPKNEKGYKIEVKSGADNQALAWADKAPSDKSITALMSKAGELGFSADDQRYALFNLYYMVLEVPADRRVVSTKHMKVGHTAFLFDCMELTDVPLKASNDPVPWQRKKAAADAAAEQAKSPDPEIPVEPDPPAPPDDTDLDPDMDLEEDEDFFVD